MLKTIRSPTHNVCVVKVRDSGSSARHRASTPNVWQHGDRIVGGGLVPGGKHGAGGSLLADAKAKWCGGSGAGVTAGVKGVVGNGSASVRVWRRGMAIK